MEKAVKGFGRFFALLKKMPYTIDEDERHSMVMLATGGRTNSLREMTRAEYDAMCDQLEGKCHRATVELRHRRSCVLRQMQKMGVDTTDWGRIDALCMDVRIAGKKFAWLSEEELRNVEVKLRCIERKGGLSSPAGKPPCTLTARRGQTERGTLGSAHECVRNKPFFESSRHET